MDADAQAALTDAEAGQCARYLRTDDTFAVLVAAADLLAPSRHERTGLVADLKGAHALAEFVLAAEQRTGVMRALADHLERAAAVGRVALMGRHDYAALMAIADTTPSQAP